MDANPELFMWPELFFSDKVKPPPEAFYELFREAWKRKTWDLKELGVPCRNVLEDESPILLTSRVPIVDSVRAMRQRKVFDEWNGKEPVWHLHWMKESRLLWEIALEDDDQFMPWLLEGLNSLWFCLAMFCNSSVMDILISDNLQGCLEKLKFVNPVVEKILQKALQMLPVLRELDSRIALATGTQGLQHVSLIYSIQLMDLCLKTGRITNNLMELGKTLLKQSKDERWEYLLRSMQIPNASPVLSDATTVMVPGAMMKSFLTPSNQLMFDY